MMVSSFPHRMSGGYVSRQRAKGQPLLSYVKYDRAILYSFVMDEISCAPPMIIIHLNNPPVFIRFIKLNNTKQLTTGY